MKTKEQIINDLKTKYPIIKIGDDNSGYSELNEKEYNSTINSWADYEFSKLLENENLKKSKNEILDKLGITEEEAKIILA